MSRLNSVYIYEVLIKNSSEDNPMTTLKIKKALQERFKINLDLTTIRRTLEVFEELETYKLCGNYDKGFYLKNDDRFLLTDEYMFNDKEINFLYISVLNSKKLTQLEKNDIITKLSNLSKNNSLKDYYDYKGLFNIKIKEENVNYYTDFDKFINAIENKQVIKIKLKAWDEPTIFYPYAILPTEDDIKLVGIERKGYYFNNSTSLVCIECNEIESFEVLENEKFPEEKPIVKFGFFNKKEIQYLKSNYYQTLEFDSSEKIDLDETFDHFMRIVKKLKSEYGAERLTRINTEIYNDFLKRLKVKEINYIIDKINEHLSKLKNIYYIRINKVAHLRFFIFILFGKNYNKPKSILNYLSNEKVNNEFYELINNIIEKMKDEDENLYMFARECFNNENSIFGISKKYNWELGRTFDYWNKSIDFLKRPENAKLIKDFYGGLID